MNGTLTTHVVFTEETGNEVEVQVEFAVSSEQPWEIEFIKFNPPISKGDFLLNEADFVNQIREANIC